MKNYSILKIVISYFIFSSLWIKLSDTILSMLVQEPKLLTKIQTYKGMLFISLSTLLIFLLLLDEARKRKKEEQEKTKYLNMIQAIINNSKVWVFIKKISGEYFLTNSKFLNDINKADILGKKTEDIFPTHISRQINKSDIDIIKTGNAQPFEFTYNDKTFICTKFPIADENNETNLIGGIASDITEFKELHKASLLVEEVFEKSKDGIVLFDIHQKIFKVNQAFLNITLFPAEKIIGTHINTIDSFIDSGNSISEITASLTKSNEWRGELWLRKNNGEIFPSWAIFTKIYLENDQNMYVGIFEDLTELKENKKNIHKLGNYDILTNLPNQFLMRDRLSQAFLNARMKNNYVGFIYFDVDNFKNINKYFDYSSGDKLLCSVTERIFAELRTDYTFARISGDEFAIILPDIINLDIITFFAEKIKQLIQNPFKIKDIEYKVSTSMGIAIYPTDGTTTEEIIKNAHTALEYVKKNGKNSYHFYSSNLNRHSKRKFELSNDLKYAIDYNELFLVYQPKVNIISSQIVGVEALLRWNHPKFGIVSPFEFIPLAEENGEIKNIGDWVINEACSQMRNWRNLSLEIDNIAINLSPIQLKNENIVKNILDVLEKYKLDPSVLEVEITEGMLMKDINETIIKLNDFKTNGVQISIDDFGTGYSSLSYLKNFPLNKLKIDRTFVKDYPEKDDGTISKIIINLANSLNLKIIAEGVETLEQLELMKSMNVEIAQGYYFYKPITSEELQVIIREKMIEEKITE